MARLTGRMAIDTKRTGSVQWNLELTAISSIAHKEMTAGSTMLLRREKVFSPDGQVHLVPVISGNSFRGVLRRLGEELLREELNYERQLPLAVAFALRNGGSLSKSGGEPISGRRLFELREMVPHLAVFGAALGSRTISGSIQCGKVRPVCAETAHLTGESSDKLVSVFEQVTLEPYSHLADGGELATDSDGQPPLVDPLMRFDIEAFAAGVTFRTWVRLERATAAEVAFTESVLKRFSEVGHLGGRSGIGMGQIRVDAIERSLIGEAWGGSVPACDWVGDLRARRTDVMETLKGLA